MDDVAESKARQESESSSPSVTTPFEIRDGRTVSATETCSRVTQRLGMAKDNPIIRTLMESYPLQSRSSELKSLSSKPGSTNW